MLPIVTDTFIQCRNVLNAAAAQQETCSVKRTAQGARRHDNSSTASSGSRVLLRCQVHPLDNFTLMHKAKAIATICATCLAFIRFEVSSAADMQQLDV
jgi:hypothetical protein